MKREKSCGRGWPPMSLHTHGMDVRSTMELPSFGSEALGERAFFASFTFGRLSSRKFSVVRADGSKHRVDLAEGVRGGGERQVPSASTCRSGSCQQADGEERPGGRGSAMARASTRSGRGQGAHSKEKSARAGSPAAFATNRLDRKAAADANGARVRFGRVYAAVAAGSLSIGRDSRRRGASGAPRRADAGGAIIAGGRVAGARDGLRHTSWVWVVEVHALEKGRSPRRTRENKRRHCGGTRLSSGAR